MNYEHGFGFVWKVTFLNVQVPVPGIDVEEVTFVGQGGGSSNVQAFIVDTHADLVRRGEYVRIPEVPSYGKGTVHPPVEGIPGDNQWLTPFWLMLFNRTDRPPPVDLEQSKIESIWAERYTSIDEILQIILTLPLSVSYIKVQREGYGSLSLAEIEVYGDKANTVDAYEYGSPIAASPVTNPYQSEMPFNVMFNNLLFDGRWIVQIAQELGNPPNASLAIEANRADGFQYPQDGVDYSGINARKEDSGASGAFGTISDVVLVITDLAGIVHPYYQDLRAQITNLPKYGHLFQAPTHTTSPYGDWRAAFELGPGGELLPRPGRTRPLGVCYGVDTTEERSGVNRYRHCTNNFGVAPLLDSKNKRGDLAEEFFLRKERSVFYQPRLRYLGPDYFTYIIYDGLNIQKHVGSKPADYHLVAENEVTVHVRNCRNYAAKLQFDMKHPVHPLCTCAQNEDAVVNNPAECRFVQEVLCEPHHPVKRPNSTRLDFWNMCVACEVNGSEGRDCIAETQRAVNMLTQRGMCSPDAYMDCSSEVITTGGQESTNYLTLSSPISATTTASITPLTNSMGSMGWYDTAPLA